MWQPDGLDVTSKKDVVLILIVTNKAMARNGVNTMFSFGHICQGKGLDLVARYVIIVQNTLHVCERIAISGVTRHNIWTKIRTVGFTSTIGVKEHDKRSEREDSM